MEVFIAAGYLLVVRLDNNRSRQLRIIAWTTFIAAIAFHLNNELLLHLRIGWFSYYMMALACVYYLPESWLWSLGRLLTWPGRRLSAWTRSKLSGALESRFRKLTIGVTVFGVVVIALMVAEMISLLDIPGTGVVGLLMPVVLVGATLVALTLGRLRSIVGYVFATGFAALLAWIAMKERMVGFDFYLDVGRRMREKGNFEVALEAYKKAARYVPKNGEIKGVKDITERTGSGDLPAFE
jgi:hypothetical protein